MKNCSVFASLISPSKMILFEKKYQTFDTVFHHQMKHLEVRQKYSAARRIFNSLLSVSSGDETLRLMFDVLLEILNAYLYLMITEQKHGRSSIKTSLSQHLLHIFSPVSERISFGDFNLEELVI